MEQTHADAAIILPSEADSRPVPTSEADLRAEREAIRGAIKATERAVSAYYLGRGELVEATVLAILTRQHLLAYGEPGTAKSAVLRAILAGLSGASFWETLVTAQTDEQGLCGPLSIKALRERDAREYVTAGYLPSVDFAFVDEVFKASGGTRNALLGIMNERAFAGAPIPLWTMVGASNELAESDDCGAFWDRFLFRSNVVSIQSNRDLFRQYLRARADRRTYQPVVSLTVRDLCIATDAVSEVVIPDLVIEKMMDVAEGCAQAGVRGSDRRWGQLTEAVKAAAWYDGCDVAEVEHLNVLRHCLWQRPEDIARVNAVLATLDRGARTKCLEIIDEVLAAWARRPSDRYQYLAAAPDYAARARTAAAKVQSIVRDSGSQRLVNALRSKMDELRAIVVTTNTDMASNAASQFSLDGTGGAK